MLKIEKLKSASSLSDLAHLLGFKPRALSYILYKVSDNAKYRKFDIPKKHGGTRTISAPNEQLGLLQRRLSDYLQDCLQEITKPNVFAKPLSHGFQRDYSIFTNAQAHRSKRFILNLDLEDFFGSINFGRVRGIFICDRNFRLDSKVATIIAQIACHDNCLPQGSPCSPVISNIVGHLLDVRISKFARSHGFTYTRYADDMTFSTNLKNVPREIAQKSDNGGDWAVGERLAELISRSGFRVNHSKTRLLYKFSRQEVTGLVVNRVVNVPKEYRYSVRAMVNSLVRQGSFNIDGKIGRVQQLHGMLNFIDQTTMFKNKMSCESHKSSHGTKEFAQELSSAEKTYRDFLAYRYLFYPDSPTVICEGKTDPIYLKAAIDRLRNEYAPLVAGNNLDGSSRPGLVYLHRTKSIERLLGLTDGGEQIKHLLNTYRELAPKVHKNERAHPTILLVDNDKVGQSLLNYVKKHFRGASNVDKSANYVHVERNLYVVLTPLPANGSISIIEDCFDDKVLNYQYRGKVFNPSNKSINTDLEFGKYIFASAVVRAQKQNINFDGFRELLDRFVSVIDANALNDLHNTQHS